MQLSPRAQAKRRQITDAARSLFLAQGFTRTSMDAITAEAGVSKQTLYAYFPSKNELLLAILDDLQVALPEAPSMGSLRSRADLRAALIKFSERLVTTLMRPDMVAVLGLTLGEMMHIPELRPTFAQALPLRLLGRTQRIIEAAAAGGVIVLHRPDVSVRMLVGPLMSFVIFNGLMAEGNPQRPSQETVAWLVDSYLRTLDFTDQAVGGLADEADGGFADEAVGGLTDQAVGGLTDETDGGFADEAVGGFTDEAVGDLTDEADGDFTDEADGGFTDQADGSQNPAVPQPDPPSAIDPQSHPPRDDL